MLKRDRPALNEVRREMVVMLRAMPLFTQFQSAAEPIVRPAAHGSPARPLHASCDICESAMF
jgi:hypothetical protein